MNSLNVVVGDIFSESSHYKVLNKTHTGISMLHLESNTIVSIGNTYFENLLTSGDQIQTTIEVGKEDKKDGTKGIRSIWEDIHSRDVFTVCFKKQDEPLSKKKLEELKTKQITDAVSEIEKTAKEKKGVANKATEVLSKIQNNPILPFTEGELRILRGYKIQFTSRDGRYDCIDIDLIGTDGNSDKAIRPININTLQWLIYHGVKYIVKS